MNVLVINLTRFGDLLQTQPVILGLRAQGHRVGLLCLDNFAAAVDLMEGVDYLAPLPGGALLAGVEGDWMQAMMRLDDFMGHMAAAFPVDMVVNTTATLSARLLARRVRPSSGRILGFGMDADGFGVSGDLWAAFLQGASAQRLNCPFNIVDMFRAAAKVADTPPRRGLRIPEAVVQAETDALLAEQTPAGCAGFVAFQLGASESRRQWPVEHFAALGTSLWRKHRLCPLLLGSPAERPLAEAYAGAASKIPFVDRIGGTDVPHLAALLLRSRLLVSNDTGTMHLAAGLGRPIMGIFLSTAQPWDTGPYLPDCCCLEPALSCHPCGFHKPCPHGLRCAGHISAGTVFHLVDVFLSSGVWPRLGEQAAMEARAWRTTTDATGFADVEDLSGHEGEVRTQWLRIQRHFYRQIIDSLSATEPAAHRLCQRALPSDMPRPSHDAVITVLRQAEDLLGLMADQAALARRMPQTHMGQRLLGTCRRVHTLLESCAPLAVLGHLWLVLTQERGDDLDTVLHMACALRQGLSDWRAWLQG